MKTNNEWKDFELIASGDGNKLERWGNVILLRPDPQAIWKAPFVLSDYKNLSAIYERCNTGGGAWKFLNKLPDSWVVSWRDLKFNIKPMGFKHTGLFPEQAVNWDKMIGLIKNAHRDISVLNLFAYTGGATVACASAGASVCHVDAAKNMVERCKENVSLSGLADKPIRYIVDDCRKFVEREIKRGKKYDAIIMDPPSYGRGANGEVWKLEDSIYDFVSLCSKVLSDNPLFVLVNSYTTGLSPIVMENILRLVLSNKLGSFDSFEVGLDSKNNIVLPCGASSWFFAK